MEGHGIGTIVKDNGVAVVDKEKSPDWIFAKGSQKKSSGSDPPWRSETWRTRGTPGGRD